MTDEHKVKVRVNTYTGGSTDEALIDFIRRIKENIPEEYLDTAKITIVGYDSDASVDVYYCRPETPQETKTRILREQKSQRYTKQSQKNEMIRLSKEVGVPKKLPDGSYVFIPLEE